MDSLFSQFDRIVVLDTETSGLNFKYDRIIELAAICCEKAGENIEITSEMDDFIKLPDGWKLDEKIVELTHITDEMLDTEGISSKESAEKFADMLSGRVLLVAYNAQFDMNYLFYFLNREGLSERLKGVKMLDALTVYKDRHDYPHKLENAIAVYELSDKVVNSHRAIDDTKALLEVLKAMSCECCDLCKYINLFGYNKKYGISGSKISSVTYKPQGYDRKQKLYE
ncbi:MAG: 3'-5' exonuclease [Clostridia bacterium]|nr:3'-5' exonuclease [Clostridia bacterium]